MQAIVMPSTCFRNNEPPKKFQIETPRELTKKPTQQKERRAPERRKSLYNTIEEV
jgi:hypothetical protein